MLNSNVTSKMKSKKNNSGDWADNSAVRSNRSNRVGKINRKAERQNKSMQLENTYE